MSAAAQSLSIAMALSIFASRMQKRIYKEVAKRPLGEDVVLSVLGPGIPSKVIGHLVQGMVEDGVLARQDGLLRVAGAFKTCRLPSDTSASIMEMLESAGLVELRRTASGEPDAYRMSSRLAELSDVKRNVASFALAMAMHVCEYLFEHGKSDDATILRELGPDSKTGLPANVVRLIVDGMLRDGTIRRDADGKLEEVRALPRVADATTLDALCAEVEKEVASRCGGGGAGSLLKDLLNEGLLDDDDDNNNNNNPEPKPKMKVKISVIKIGEDERKEEKDKPAKPSGLGDVNLN